MVHPATIRTVRAAIAALGVPVEIGFVFPPKPGEERGFGQWTNRDLSAADVIDMLPRAAAANTRGANVFWRLGPHARDAHPGILMLDDLTAASVKQLAQDGFEPCLTVETSPGNFQSWIKLVSAGTVPYPVMAQAIRQLVHAYGADARAVSPRQPGRVPGFTNRKPKHQREDGLFPFVRMTSADPGRVASTGPSLLDELSTYDTGGAAAGAAPKTPHVAAVGLTRSESDVTTRLLAIYRAQETRIRREIDLGRRPPTATSASEIDFAAARLALSEGISEQEVSDWIRNKRLEKAHTYAERTTRSALSWRPKM